MPYKIPLSDVNSEEIKGKEDQLKQKIVGEEKLVEKDSKNISLLLVEQKKESEELEKEHEALKKIIEMKNKEPKVEINEERINELKRKITEQHRIISDEQEKYNEIRGNIELEKNLIEQNKKIFLYT